MQPEASISPDAQYVLAGGESCHIHVWNAREGDGREVAQWRGHTGTPRVLKWAPSRCLVASGCTDGGLALWISPGA